MPKFEDEPLLWVALFRATKVGSTHLLARMKAEDFQSLHTRRTRESYIGC